MIIGRDYLLRKSAGPSALKLLFDTRIVPLAVNGAGEFEGLLARSSARTGIRSAVMLAGMATVASITIVYLLRRRNNTAERLR